MIPLISSQSKLGKVSYVLQNEPKGLGHAVWLARKYFRKNEMFAVVLPDDIILSKIPVIFQLIKIYNKTKGSVVGLETVPKKDVSKYGIVEKLKDFNNYCSINNIVEKPKINDAPSNLSVTGRYILDSKIFDYLSFQKKGFGGEIQLTDALNTLKTPNGLYGLKFDGNRFDCGGKLGFVKANIFFGLNDKEIKNDLKKVIKSI
ncbi:MAG: hypothetical protein CMP34_00285 [Rickettsiales bacterium]|nr:hypothetical protein [Rickettsiales bacterium]